MDRKTKGKRGEARVKKFYEDHGGEVLEANYRYKRNEVDLIVLLEEELLVFVEVKTRTRTDFGRPETFVSSAQKKRIKETAEEFIFGINWTKDIRFDIGCVDVNGNVEVFEDAF